MLLVLNFNFSFRLWESGLLNMTLSFRFGLVVLYGGFYLICFFLFFLFVQSYELCNDYCGPFLLPHQTQAFSRWVSNDHQPLMDLTWINR